MKQHTTQQETKRFAICPSVGQTMVVYGQICTITKVRPAGTVDVLSPQGQAYRVSGLSF